MYAQVPNHEPSLMLMNCGESVQPRPSVGAWVLYGLGSENRNLPGFVAMCPSGLPVKDSENWQAGFLPGIYQGTYIDPQHMQIDKLIENIRSPHATLTTQRRQLDLLQTLNAEHRGARRYAAGITYSVVRTGIPNADRGCRSLQRGGRTPAHSGTLRTRGSCPADAHRPATSRTGGPVRTTVARSRAALG